LPTEETEYHNNEIQFRITQPITTTTAIKPPPLPLSKSRDFHFTPVTPATTTTTPKPPRSRNLFKTPVHLYRLANVVDTHTRSNNHTHYHWGVLTQRQWNVFSSEVLRQCKKPIISKSMTEFSATTREHRGRDINSDNDNRRIYSK
jgi:hypothetical protein